MPGDSADVPVTADACVVIRAQVRPDGPFLRDPHAALFVTEEGRAMARLAQALDPVYTAYNLARYTWIGRRLAWALTRFPQVVLLGSGYDTRALFLDEVRTSRVFEVDFAATLESKRAILARHGVEFPARHSFVPADLAAPGLGERLRAAGFRPDLPAFAVAEGVLFFLPAEASAGLLDPRALGLAPGSRLVFDCWSKTRVRRLNARIAARTGRALFRESPLPDDPAALRRHLRERGHGRVSVTPLGRLARRLAADFDTPDRRGAWRVIEARVS